MKPYSCILLYILAHLAWTPAVRAATPRVLYRIETVAGSANIGDGGPATAAQMSNIQGIAADRLGNLYISDTDNQRVRKISNTGIVTTIAGTGIPGFSGDGGPASAAQLNLPYGLAVDLAGNVYVADFGNNCIRRIGPDGVITTIAGTGHKGTSPDGGAATEASLLAPRNVAVDAAGNLYISEFEGNRVRKVSPDGKIATFAGTGIRGYRGDGGPATFAQLSSPAGLAVDRSGSLYIADSQNNCVRKVTSGGTISTLLQGGAIRLFTPAALAVDSAGAIYVGDSGNMVCVYNATGKWTDYAGYRGPAGGDTPALKVSLSAVHGLAADMAGNLYIADGARIRRVDSSGQIQTIAGDGYLHASGDGGPAASALLIQPWAVALDPSGNLYIADTGAQRVRQVSPSGVIATIAGTGIASASGDGQPATAAGLNSPMGVAVDLAGNILIADTYSHRIRQIAADGVIRTIAGTGTAGYGSEGLQPTQTQLSYPRAVCTDRAGAMYIVDTSNYRVLRAASGAAVETVAGNGSTGDSGDGGPARLAQLSGPSGCAPDSYGDLFIADSNRIRKVTPAGIITTVAGTGEPGFSGDEGLAIAASLNAPRGVAVDDGGNIFIADTGNNRIRQVTPDGVIHTIAGRDTNGFTGDGGPAQAAQLDAPSGLFLDGAGALYVADTNNNRIRRLVQDAALPPPAPLPATLTCVNAASQRQGPVAPGEIVTIFGSGIGPAAGVSGTFDSAGLLANALGGSEVRFDGVPAPLFYAQSGQINVQVPYTVNGNSLTHVEVFYQGHSFGTVDLPVAAATPALFAVAINQDGTTNSETSPAQRGAIVTFFATGEGLTDGPNIAGQAADAPYPHAVLPVTLAVAGINADLLYAGSIPGGVGVLQVNARVPAGFVPPGLASVDLALGAFTAPTVTVWLK